MVISVTKSATNEQVGSKPVQGVDFDLQINSDTPKKVLISDTALLKIAGPKSTQNSIQIFQSYRKYIAEQASIITSGELNHLPHLNKWLLEAMHVHQQN